MLWLTFLVFVQALFWHCRVSRSQVLRLNASRLAAVKCENIDIVQQLQYQQLL